MIWGLHHHKWVGFSVIYLPGCASLHKQILKGQSNKISTSSFSSFKPAWATDQRVKIFSILVKGAVSRDFRPIFFHKSNPSGPLINKLKWFFLKIRFRKDIRYWSLKNSTLRRLTLRGVEFFWQASPLKC